LLTIGVSVLKAPATWPRLLTLMASVPRAPGTSKTVVRPRLSRRKPDSLSGMPSDPTRTYSPLIWPWSLTSKGYCSTPGSGASMVV
jgi:hypothetical protein